MNMMKQSFILCGSAVDKTPPEYVIEIDANLFFFLTPEYVFEPPDIFPEVQFLIWHNNCENAVCP